MNAMLSSGGYPWTTIPVEERDRHMKNLEAASVDQNIKPLAEFLAWLVEGTMQDKPVAKMRKKNATDFMLHFSVNMGQKKSCSL